MKQLFVLFGLFIGPMLAAQAPVEGMWKTVDDETNRAKSHVKLYVENGKLYGKVVKLLEEGKGPNTLCTECKGDRKDRPIEGMIVLEGLEKDGDEWEDGTILDPANGKEYTAKVWLDDEGNLKVRGYIAFLYRTQTWYRM